MKDNEFIMFILQRLYMQIKLCLVLLCGRRRGHLAVPKVTETSGGSIFSFCCVRGGVGE